MSPLPCPIDAFVYTAAELDPSNPVVREALTHGIDL